MSKKSWAKNLISKVRMRYGCNKVSCIHLYCRLLHWKHIMNNRDKWTLYHTLYLFTKINYVMDCTEPNQFHKVWIFLMEFPSQHDNAYFWSRNYTYNRPPLAFWNIGNLKQITTNLKNIFKCKLIILSTVEMVFQYLFYQRCAILPVISKI